METPRASRSAARRILVWIRYWCGDNPDARLNSRVRWVAETPADAASARSDVRTLSAKQSSMMVRAMWTNRGSITYTGDGSDIAYWNRYVAITQMHGHGSFSEPRTGVSVNNTPPEVVAAVIPALQEYQLSLVAPAPPAGSFDAAAAERGRVLFNGAANCASCHSGAAVGWQHATARGE